MCVHNVFLDKFTELCVYLSFHLSCFCMWRCGKKHVGKHLSPKVRAECRDVYSCLLEAKYEYDYEYDQKNSASTNTSIYSSMYSSISAKNVHVAVHVLFLALHIRSPTLLCHTVFSPYHFLVTLFGFVYEIVYRVVF